VKYTAQDLFQLAELRKATTGKKIYFGTDEMFLGAAAMGTDGGIGSTYNLIGDVYLGIEQAVAAGNIGEARALQSAANDFIAILLRTGVVPGIKHCLTRLEVPVGPARAPFPPVSAAGVAQLDAWMETSGLMKHGSLSKAVRS
jgi:N-acetylneuraminate lyase